MQIKNICCVGAGYVGGPTMAVIALKCPEININVVDNNPDKIYSWNGPIDNLPVYEPGLAEIIKEVRDKNLNFSNDIKGSIEKSEMIFMAVNTPTKTEGEGAGMAADLKYIEACAKDIAKYSKSDKIVKVFCFGRFPIIVSTPLDDIIVISSPILRSKSKLSSLPIDI